MASRSVLSRLFIFLINLPLPGAGLVLLGYSVRGIFLFAIFGFLVDGTLIGLYGPAGGAMSDRLALVAGLMAFSFWIYISYEVWRRAFGRYRQKVLAEKDKHFRTGLIHYLSGDNRSAIREFRKALRLDSEDVDSLFYLGMALKAGGRNYHALRSFKKCLAYDIDHRWQDDVSRQVEPLLKR